MKSSWDVGPWTVTLQADTGEYVGAIPLPGTHTGNIVPARECEKACRAGGFYLTERDRAAVRTADCLPLVVASDTSAIIAHISRKSLLTPILEHVVEYIPKDAVRYVWMGPHICQKHFGFEYEGEEIAEFAARFPEAVHRENDITYLSIKTVVENWLHQHVGDSVSITDTGICTYESELPSWKRWREEHGDVRPIPQFISILQGRPGIAD